MGLGQSGIKYGKKMCILKIFRRRRVSMFTGLKVPSLTHKCVPYKPEPEHWGTLWIWIFQVFKYKNEIGAQRVDEKLGSSGENV